MPTLNSTTHRIILPQRLWLFGLLWPLMLGVPWHLLTYGRFFGKFDRLVVGMLLASCLFCALTDIFRKKIYNWITYPVFVIIVALNLVTAWLPGWDACAERFGTIGPSSMFAGMAACFVVALIPYAISQGGAGDAKLAVSVGAAFGMYDGLLVICVAYMFAGVTALIVVTWGYGPWFVGKAVFHRVGHWFLPLWISPASEDEKKLFKEPVPLAPYFFIGILIVATGVLQCLV